MRPGVVMTDDVLSEQPLHLIPITQPEPNTRALTFAHPNGGKYRRFVFHLQMITNPGDFLCIPLELVEKAVTRFVTLIRLKVRQMPNSFVVDAHYSATALLNFETKSGFCYLMNATLKDLEGLDQTVIAALLEDAGELISYIPGMLGKAKPDLTLDSKYFVLNGVLQRTQFLLYTDPYTVLADPTELAFSVLVWRQLRAEITRHPHLFKANGTMDIVITQDPTGTALSGYLFIMGMNLSTFLLEKELVERVIDRTVFGVTYSPQRVDLQLSIDKWQFTAYVGNDDRHLIEPDGTVRTSIATELFEHLIYHTADIATIFGDSGVIPLTIVLDTDGEGKFLLGITPDEVDFPENEEIRKRAYNPFTHPLLFCKDHKIVFIPPSTKW